MKNLEGFPNGCEVFQIASKESMYIVEGSEEDDEVVRVCMHIRVCMCAFATCMSECMDVCVCMVQVHLHDFMAECQLEMQAHTKG